MSIRVLVADDQEVVRTGVASMFQGAGVRIVGEATTADEAVAKTLSAKPDVLLIEARLGDEESFATVEKLRRRMPELRVIIFSAYDNARYVSRAVEAGAVDYLVKGCSRQELIAAVKRAATKEEIAAESILQRYPLATARGRAPVDTLTPRELEVVRHVALGESNREIGKALGISVETVKEHVQKILRKIDGTTRTQAAVWATKEGLV